jgi:hypothetical protein
MGLLIQNIGMRPSMMSRKVPPPANQVFALAGRHQAAGDGKNHRPCEIKILQQGARQFLSI